MSFKFNPGSIVATPGALEALRASGSHPLTYLNRHLSGDWGEVDEHDRRENEVSLEAGFRLMSVYTLPNVIFKITGRTFLVTSVK